MRAGLEQLRRGWDSFNRSAQEGWRWLRFGTDQIIRGGRGCGSAVEAAGLESDRHRVPMGPTGDGLFPGVSGIPGNTLLRANGQPKGPALEKRSKHGLVGQEASLQRSANQDTSKVSSRAIDLVSHSMMPSKCCTSGDPVSVTWREWQAASVQQTFRLGDSNKSPSGRTFRPMFRDQLACIVRDRMGSPASQQATTN